MSTKNLGKIKKNETATRIRLLPIEDFMLVTGGRLVSSLTWFAGDHATAAGVLRDRLRDIVAANPWLTGQIVRRNATNYLEYFSPAAEEEEAALSELFLHVSPKKSLFSRTTSVVTVSAVARQMGYTVQPQRKHRVFALTVIPCRTSPTTHFCVFASMSHIVGDGHTFYSIYNYLIGGGTGSSSSATGSSDKNDDAAQAGGSGVAVPVLEAIRIESSPQQVAEALGGVRREPLLTQSLAFLLPAAVGMVVGKLRALCCMQFQTRQHYCFLKATEINKMKEEAGQADTTVDFCSTNDVISAWIFSNARCRHGFMTVNLRGRLEGHTENHAGNYITLLYYRIPADCSTPGLVRRSVSALKRAKTASSPPARLLTGGAVILTNWATFASDRVTLPNCREELHCPLLTNQLDKHPANVILGVVFRAQSNQLGMLICGTGSKMDGLDPCPFASGKDFI